MADENHNLFELQKYDLSIFNIEDKENQIIKKLDEKLGIEDLKSKLRLIEEKFQDLTKLQIKVNDDGIIEDAKFKTYGCGSAIASSSLLTEWVKGKTLTEASLIKNTEIVEELALPPVKVHCSVLAEDAIKTAIADLQGKQKSSGKWTPSDT